ncbi:uncharacterized protein OCT59_004926 [Rhizophagus irregularis]|uniref:uncharacterized protein n=1 Tax=Rhizophagus irregularis TaxID=588596 RepID=UPI003325F915|nr:hypothetical protein OCT59_004926 [Rhizophagus irregularis]
MIASNELKLELLSKFTEKCLITENNHLLRNDPVGILQISAKVGYSNGDSHSIGCFSNNGPFFGGNNSDLVFHNNGNWKSKNPNSYSRVDIPSNFRADDYEVFQVTDTRRSSSFLEKEIEIPQIENVKNSGSEEILKSENKKSPLISLFKGKR